jgi:EpsI family protein
MNNKSSYLVIGILVAVLAVSVPLYLVVPKNSSEAQVAKFPMQIGAWSGKDIPVEDNAYEILETKNLILREYTRGADSVFLYIIYSKENRKVSHPPEVCFEGSGITIVKKDKSPMTLADGKKIVVNRLIVEKGGATNIVLYWYKAGREYTDNYLVQQLRTAANQLRFKPSSSALIRLSAEVKADGPEKTLRDMQDFLQEASGHFEEIIP